MKLVLFMLLTPLLTPLAASASPYAAFKCSVALMQQFAPFADSIMFAPETRVMAFQTHPHVHGDQVFGFKIYPIASGGDIKQYSLKPASTVADSDVKIRFSRNNEDGQLLGPGSYGVKMIGKGKAGSGWMLEGGRDFAMATYTEIPELKELGHITMICHRRGGGL